jgi:hypothetical protein
MYSSTAQSTQRVFILYCTLICLVSFKDTGTSFTTLTSQVPLLLPTILILVSRLNSHTDFDRQQVIVRIGFMRNQLARSGNLGVDHLYVTGQNNRHGPPAPAEEPLPRTEPYKHDPL